MSNGRTLEQAENQLAALAEEQRKLAQELDALQKQSQVLEKTARDARDAQASAEKDRAGCTRELDATSKKLKALDEVNQRLTAQVERLNKQVAKTPLNPLSVEEATELFRRVLSSFSAIRTLEVRDASLTLKLATAKLGDMPVLLLPEPNAVDPAMLHELKLDLTASGSAEPAAAVEPTTERRSVTRARSGGRSAPRTRS
jgi:hypothetical protein